MSHTETVYEAPEVGLILDFPIEVEGQKLLIDGRLFGLGSTIVRKLLTEYKHASDVLPKMPGTIELWNVIQTILAREVKHSLGIIDKEKQDEEDKENEGMSDDDRPLFVSHPEYNLPECINLLDYLQFPHLFIISKFLGPYLTKEHQEFDKHALGRYDWAIIRDEYARSAFRYAYVFGEYGYWYNSTALSIIIAKNLVGEFEKEIRYATDDEYEARRMDKKLKSFHKMVALLRSTTTA